MILMHVCTEYLLCASTPNDSGLLEAVKDLGVIFI